MQVVIHADASTQMGTGHVIRSLALAAALRDAGARVTLATLALPPSLGSRASDIGVDVVDRAVAPRDPDWVVIDGYHLGHEQRGALANPDVRRLVIDDLGSDVPDAAVVVDPNLAARAIGFQPGPERLAGPAYALLRPEFAGAAAERAQPVVADRVLVTLGGADPRDATRLVVAALAVASPRPQARIVIGAAHPAPEAVRRAARAAGFEVIRDAPSMAPHLAWADIVITGCGSSVLEIVRLGRPLLGIVLADNQRVVAAAVQQEGLGIIAGSHPGIVSDEVLEALDRLRHDRESRQRIAGHGPGLVDGRGARRVARAMATGPLDLRAATLDDADRLLAWRNDEVARRSSFDPQPIDAATHASWLRDQLATPDRVWIGELGSQPVGVIRFAIDDGIATASVALDPERRGHGIGSRLISAGCARVWAANGRTSFEAWIRPENRGSLRAFSHAGFRLASSESDRLMMRLDADSIG
jgi:spore coat polysaccharide biosynthesis predicted glycosyltransferase SpsG/RimJ/RimL family protein N-acetyltransferase